MKLPPTLVERIKSPLVVPAVVVAVFLAGGNLAVFPLMDAFRQRDWGALFVYWCFGTIAAGGGLAGICGAIGPGSHWIRQTTGFVMAIVLVVCWLLGATLSGERFDDDIFGPMFCLPVLYLSLQSPLLVARLVFGWRIELVEQSEPAAPTPITIRGMMITTAMVAISLALARGAEAYSREGPGFWAILAIVAATFAGLSLIGTLPSVYLMLRLRNIRTGIMILAGYAVLLAMLLWIVMWIVTGIFPGPGAARMRPRLWDWVGATTSIVACAVALSAALLSLRHLGFRLTRHGMPRS